MNVTTCRLTGPVEFVSIGQFVSGPGWRHSRRVIDSFELIFVRRGVLPIRVGERDMHVGAGEIIMLPRGVEHSGTAIITDDLEFYWLHFRSDDVRVMTTTNGADLPQDDHVVIIPDRSRIPEPDRVAVLCGQLIDLYARFGPHRNAYCDYAATGLLLEISAQERAVLSTVASMTAGHDNDGAAESGIAGFRADGRTILSVDADGSGRWHGGSYSDARHWPFGGRPSYVDHGSGIDIGTPAGVNDVIDDRGSNNTAIAVDRTSPIINDHDTDARVDMRPPVVTPGWYGTAGRQQFGLAPMLAVRAWIMANAYDDITVAGIAARFHYSPSYLTAMYKRVFGIGVAEQITEYRIDHARDLLSSTASPIADIAHEVGYDDPKYFMRVFKRRTGLTPGQYRDAFPKRLYNTL
ncbi:AraC family transcriptional regulator [Bifidobacterium ramosum]|uniref:AraC family transcriptional regulator n=1 Tax=Bifidobacterium ramosum TaxID=1798158 RepID=A0A6L4WY86_9BIFI|nr:AraC family transcriptional regulator [Bifidobacterium ramosum]KAB8287181.1 AraC family transcriptional regulator [Bifidobacterium ramosum]